MKSSRAEIKIY